MLLNLYQIKALQCKNNILKIKWKLVLEPMFRMLKLPPTVIILLKN